MNLPADHYEPHLCRCFGQNHWCLSSTRAATRTTPLTSTTQFEYTDLKLSGSVPEGNLAASLTVRNSDALDGVEVVQLYVSDLAYSIPRTRKELKGFEKVFLKAGQSQTIRLR